MQKIKRRINLFKRKKYSTRNIDYLKEGLTQQELRSILEKLDMRPDELMRKSETIYKTEIKGKKLTDDQLIIKMIEHPKLIERPILVLGNKATIGRPAENFMSIMG